MGSNNVKHKVLPTTDPLEAKNAYPLVRQLCNVKKCLLIF